jgi:hypothetical protein
VEKSKFGLDRNDHRETRASSSDLRCEALQDDYALTKREASSQATTQRQSKQNLPSSRKRIIEKNKRVLDFEQAVSPNNAAVLRT